jgi:hypothetical protein
MWHSLRSLGGQTRTANRVAHSPRGRASAPQVGPGPVDRNAIPIAEHAIETWDRLLGRYEASRVGLGSADRANCCTVTHDTAKPDRVGASPRQAPGALLETLVARRICERTRDS